MARLFLRLALLIVLTFAFTTWVVPDFVVWVFKEHIHRFDIGQVRGTLALITQRYQATPSNQWPAVTEALQSQFKPLGIGLYREGDPALAELEPERLSQGQVGVHMVQNGDIGAAAMAVGNRQVVVIDYPPYPAGIALLYWLVNGLVGLSLVACVLVWLRPHWRDLERLRLAAARLGEGDLSARSGIAHASNIGNLARVFDTMAERTETLIAQQRDLLNAVSHELRTPLSRLRFGLALLMAKVEPQQQRQVEALQGHGLALQQLIDELMAFNTLRASVQPLERIEVDVPAFIDSVVVPFFEDAEQVGVSVHVDAPASLPAVALEPKLTARALQNILGNALRYAHCQVCVEVRASQGRLTLVVEDDGEGIPEADYQQVFQPFFRLDRSRDRATGGVGLGLAISRSCLERQGGTLSVGRAALGGARFTLSLPLQYFQVTEAVTLRGAP